MPKVTVEFVNEHGEKVKITVSVNQNWGTTVELERNNMHTNTRVWTSLETKVIGYCIRLITEPGVQRQEPPM